MISCQSVVTENTNDLIAFIYFYLFYNWTASFALKFFFESADPFCALSHFFLFCHHCFFDVTDRTPEVVRSVYRSQKKICMVFFFVIDLSLLLI